MTLSTPVSVLPGVGEHRAPAWEKLGLRTVLDLIRHLPSRYEQEFAEGSIADLPMQGHGSARGTVVSTRYVPGGRGRNRRGRFQARLEDHSGKIDVVWFNGSYLRDKLHAGMTIRVAGKAQAYQGHAQLVNPQWEELDESDQPPATRDRIRPVYPASEQVPSRAIETVITAALPQVHGALADPLPGDYLEQRALPDLAAAYRAVHLPDREEDYKSGRRRLIYNELLLLQLGIAIRRHYARTRLRAWPLNRTEAIDEHIRERFPFDLTEAQDQVIGEIAADLEQTKPMNRLLQGDVGAGKTVVALYAMLLAVADRKQAALMAPTELLAEQHYASISEMLRDSTVRVALLTSGQVAAGSAQREALLGEIERGRYDIIIGTSALLSDAVRFHDLAVAVVDEQHRFGVHQRAALRSMTARPSSDQATDPDAAPAELVEAYRSPHYLVMTATPIPRSLSLTLFGDLDVSVLSGLPPGRSAITTRVVLPDQADKVYHYLAGRVEAGEQAYIVLPAIEASEHESARDLKNLRAHQKLLAEKYFPGVHVASVHGRLKRRTRESVMARFRAGRVGVLVATTVIEVGVDVPNATIMVIEHAERFGLAQLHQLRGRIGRGKGGPKSLCVFIADPNNPDAAQRMEAIGSTTDGFAIAEKDLVIRGMGEFFGTRQHGAPPLRIARLPEDMDLLRLARHDAQQIVQADPTLTDPANTRLRKVLIQQYGNSLGLIDVG